MFLSGQRLIDFDDWLRLPPPGHKRCPCGQFVSLADEPLFAEDAAGNMRAWHRPCLDEDRAWHRNKAARRKR